MRLRGAGCRGGEAGRRRAGRGCDRGESGAYKAVEAGMRWGCFAGDKGDKGATGTARWLQWALEGRQWICKAGCNEAAEGMQGRSNGVSMGIATGVERGMQWSCDGSSVGLKQGMQWAAVKVPAVYTVQHGRQRDSVGVQEGTQRDVM